LTSTAFIVSIQATVSWQQRGIATAANMFMRNLGNTIGAALLGGILNNRLANYLSANSRPSEEKLTVDSATLLLKEDEHSNLSESARELLQEGLTQSLHWVYYVVLTFALVSLILISFIPKNKEGSAS
jgi:hypothetical protein